jgi:RNA polymerase sigma factor (sigma-70 family)
MADARLVPVLRYLHQLTPPEERSDGRLLEQVAARGDAAALATLVQRHGPLVWRVCRRMLPRVHDAEDAYQATLLALALRAGAIRKPGALAAWLHATAFRIARRIRQENARQLPVKETVSAPVADPAHEVAWRELGRVVEEEVAALPDGLRVPLLLCYWEGQTNDEAARRLGWPVGTVKTRLARARQLLHGRLTRRGVTLPAGVAALLLAPGPCDAAAPAIVAHPSLRVVTLAQLAVRFSAARRLVAIFFLAVSLAVAGAFAFAASAPPQLPDARPVKQPEKLLARVDRFGDPLPEGVRTRLGTSRLRHGNGSTLAFAPDGKSLLTFGGDRTFRTWDLASGRLRKERRLPGGALRTSSAILSEDGRLLAFQDESERGVYFLWDVERNRLLHKLPLGDPANYQAIFSPDGKTLVTAGMYSGLLRAWDVETGRQHLVGKHKAHLRGLSYAADGTSLLSWSDNRNDPVRLWDVKAGRELHRPTFPTDTRGATLSPDGRVVASLRLARPQKFLGIEFRDAATGKPVPGWISSSAENVRSAQFTPDGKALLLSTPDGIVVWDPAQGKRVRTLPGMLTDNVRISPDGKAAAGLGVEGMMHAHGSVVQVWDFSSGTPHPANSAADGHLGEVEGVVFSPDGRLVASACAADQSVRLWNAASGRVVQSMRAGDRFGFQALAFSPDGKHLFAGTSPALICWEVATGRETGRFPLSEAGEDRRHLLHMQLTDDGRTLLAVCQQNFSRSRGGDALLAWDVASGKRVRSVTGPPDASLGGNSRFSGDGRILVTTDGIVFDGMSGKERLRLSPEKDQFAYFPLALSRDGALAASSIHQKHTEPTNSWAEMVAVQVWETATGQPVMRLKGGKPGQLAFTPDGRCLIAADREELAMWDLASGKIVARRLAPSFYSGTFGPSFVSAMAYAADGRTLATGHMDTCVLLWDIPPPPRQAVSLTIRERETLWADLAGDDAGRAWQAIDRLANAPGQAVPMLRERLRPAKGPPAEELRRLIADLDAPRYEVREAATKRLAELDDGAHAALRKALHEQPSLEVRRRVEPLLDRPSLVKDRDVLRSLRAVRVLEGIGTPAARQVMEGLAKGTDGLRLTEEARAALGRLSR